jgi:hypothetical protein
MTTNTHPFRTLNDVKRRSAEAGSHFFDRASMRFFDSRVSARIHPSANGAFFVTSERYESDPRRYTVRYITVRGFIRTVGDFQAYASALEAHREAGCLAALTREAQAQAERLMRSRNAAAQTVRSQHVAYTAPAPMPERRVPIVARDILARIAEELTEAAAASRRLVRDERRYGRGDDFAPDNGAPVGTYHANPQSGEGALYSLEYLEAKTGRSTH